MATLESLIGRPLHELSEEEVTNWIENLRSTRQLFTDGAYEARSKKRAASTKRKGPEVTAEFLAEIDELAEELDL